MGELLTCLKVLINKLWCNKLINNDFTSRWDPDFCTVIAVPFFKILKQNLAVHSFFLKNVLFLISVCLKKKIKSEIENLLRLSLKCKPCCELHTHHSIH